MFLTIGFVAGFIIGWWVNEKVENLVDHLRIFRKNTYVNLAIILF